MMKNIIVDDINIFELENKIEQDYIATCGCFADGDWDARMGFEPSPENWLSADYRKGYLHGIEEKYNDKFDLLD